MKNELFDKFFGPPMNMPIQSPTLKKSEGINFVFLGGGLLILVLFYKLNSNKIIKEKKDTV